jgi:hypothetical protein
VRIDSITPASAGPNGGGQLTIRGTGFGSNGSGGKVCLEADDSEGALICLYPEVISWSDTQIVVKIPAESQEIKDDGGKTSVAVLFELDISSNDLPFTYTGGAGQAQLTGALSANGTAVTDQLACGAGSSCVIQEQLSTTETVAAGQPAAVTARRVQAQRKTVIVGSRTVTIPAGEKRTVIVKLNTAGRRLLGRFGKLPLELTIKLARGPEHTLIARRALTLGPPTKKRRGHRRDNVQHPTGPQALLMALIVSDRIPRS